MGKRLSARATGLKVAKIGTIGLLLSIPVVGQVTGALLVAKLLLGAKATWYDTAWVERKAQQGAQADSPAFGGSAA